ncbi:MAG: pirin [Bacteroidetes bacterium]|nr:MAG: pirin [Bacteroidota bacterium]
MEQLILHTSASRGHANHGWLESRHTFSFADYHHPQRMNFGVLRVLNDDIVDPGQGFSTHPHNNMEIISIPLEGVLEHRDSMGNVALIRKGDVQVMSAGSGIRHSEYNKSDVDVVKFLQIWVIPNKRNVEPRYDQITLDLKLLHNNLYQILSPDLLDEGVWIHQDAWFSLGNFDEGYAISYKQHKPGNGLYAFVLKGNFNIQGVALELRDGLGITGAEQLQITAGSNDAALLLMEVPMQL